VLVIIINWIVELLFMLKYSIFILFLGFQ